MVAGDAGGSVCVPSAGVAMVRRGGADRGGSERGDLVDIQV